MAKTSTKSFLKIFATRYLLVWICLVVAVGGLSTFAYWYQQQLLKQTSLKLPAISQQQQLLEKLVYQRIAIAELNYVSAKRKESLIRQFELAWYNVITDTNLLSLKAEDQLASSGLVNQSMQNAQSQLQEMATLVAQLRLIESQINLKQQDALLSIQLLSNTLQKNYAQRQQNISKLSGLNNQLSLLQSINNTLPIFEQILSYKQQLVDVKAIYSQPFTVMAKNLASDDIALISQFFESAENSLVINDVLELQTAFYSAKDVLLANQAYFSLWQQGVILQSNIAQAITDYAKLMQQMEAQISQVDLASYRILMPYVPPRFHQYLTEQRAYWLVVCILGFLVLLTLLFLWRSKRAVNQFVETINVAASKANWMRSYSELEPMREKLTQELADNLVESPIPVQQDNERANALQIELNEMIELERSSCSLSEQLQQSLQDNAAQINKHRKYYWLALRQLTQVSAEHIISASSQFEPIVSKTTQLQQLLLAHVRADLEPLSNTSMSTCHLGSVMANIWVTQTQYAHQRRVKLNINTNASVDTMVQLSQPLFNQLFEHIFNLIWLERELASIEVTTTLNQADDVVDISFHLPDVRSLLLLSHNPSSETLVAQLKHAQCVVIDTLIDGLGCNLEEHYTEQGSAILSLTVPIKTDDQLSVVSTKPLMNKQVLILSGDERHYINVQQELLSQSCTIESATSYAQAKHLLSTTALHKRPIALMLVGSDISVAQCTELNTQVASLAPRLRPKIYFSRVISNANELGIVNDIGVYINQEPLLSTLEQLVMAEQCSNIAFSTDEIANLHYHQLPVVVRIVTENCYDCIWLVQLLNRLGLSVKLQSFLDVKDDNALEEYYGFTFIQSLLNESAEQGDELAGYYDVVCNENPNEHPINRVNLNTHLSEFIALLSHWIRPKCQSLDEMTRADDSAPELADRDADRSTIVSDDSDKPPKGYPTVNLMALTKRFHLPELAISMLENTQEKLNDCVQELALAIEVSNESQQRLLLQKIAQYCDLLMLDELSSLVNHLLTLESNTREYQRGLFAVEQQVMALSEFVDAI